MKRLLALALILVVSACATEASQSVALSTTTTTRPTTTTTRPRPTTTTTRPRPTTTTLSQEAEMLAWISASQDELEDVGTVLGTVTDAATLGVPSLLVDACIEMGEVVARAQTTLPTPDPELTNAYGSALEEFALAANDCVQGVSALDADLINSASEHLAAGAALIGEATQALEKWAR